MAVMNDLQASPNSRAHILSAIQTVMGKVFGVPAGEITEDTTPADVPRWDSLAMVTVMIGLERRLGMTIPLEIGLTACSVGALADGISILAGTAC